MSASVRTSRPTSPRARRHPRRSPRRGVHHPREGRHGKVPAAALKAFERLMRQGERHPPPGPAARGRSSGWCRTTCGKPLEVVSGFRAYTPTQYTPHSSHNVGRALDFRVQGVRNEELRDFCRTLREHGLRLLPEQHLRARRRARHERLLGRPLAPGRAAAVREARALADEGTSDVDAPRATGRASSTRHGARGRSAAFVALTCAGDALLSRLRASGLTGVDASKRKPLGRSGSPTA